MDVYVLCFSEHSDSDDDGLLSMWRAYGAEGNGAAMVFDSSKVMSKSESPITFGPVRYGDDTERSALLNGIFLQVAAIITTLTIGDADIFKLAWQIHWRIKYFALFTKHAGFREEHEWRLVYMKQRDPKNELKDAVGYNISRHGIEPKLRFSLKDRYEFTEPDLSLEKLVRKIILGPTTATPLAKKAFLRMLELTGKTELMGRVVGSTIPYRRR
jgi:hypothetical protein